MGELRKDYILDRFVLLSTDRGKRPHQLVLPIEKEKKGVCFFCPGNEHLTPPETHSLEKEGNWQIRVFPNKFAAVKNEGESNIKTDNTFFTFSNNFGYHEVIVETPDHNKELADLSIDEIKQVLEVFSHRIDSLSREEGVKYVQIFKNKGSKAGTSIPHTHSQVIAYNVIPSSIKEKITATNNFNDCPYCNIINIEKNSLRSIFENDSFVSFAPYASRFPLEAWIFPKEHVRFLSELTEEDYYNFAEILKKLLSKLKTINAPYNFFICYSPNNEDLHLHMEILPRINTLAGFELSTNNYINHISPEDAALFYKKK